MEEQDYAEEFKDILDELSELANKQKIEDLSNTDYRWCSQELLDYSLNGLESEKI